MAKILISDDEAPIRRALREILEYLNYEIEEAVNGFDCLTKVMASQPTFDLVIQDIKTPVMNGLQVLENLKELFPNLPVIIHSGILSPQLKEEALSKGAFEVFQKPGDLFILLETIERALLKGCV